MAFTFVTCDDTFLILKRGDTGGEDWTIPGGKPEGNESHLEAGIRELAEEGGFFCQDPAQYQHPSSFDSNGRFSQEELKHIKGSRMPMFTLRVGQNQRNVPAARMNLRDENSDSDQFEHTDFKWVTIEEAEKYLAMYILPTAKRALQEGKKYSLKARLL